MSVVVRFAPSPTGFLHIGGARTALFNWLFARHHGGRYLLRIEDTDRQRSTEPAIRAILDGLDWLGLAADDPPVFQFQRVERHRQAALELLDQDHAYRCYCQPAELEAMRAEARAAGRVRAYDGRWRDRDPATAPPGVDPVIRFKAPLSGETIVADRVQGDVRFANDQLDDMVLLRADGTPTYMLSVVVDDIDMGITHVIRGDDHLVNAARQANLFEALGRVPPVFAHIPLIHGADGSKLSKRHGALGVDAYRDQGYLPEALRNYLLRLGWAHGDEEVISTERAIEWFDLDGIGRSSSRFDFARLGSLNAHYIKEAADPRLVDLVAPRLESDGHRIDETARARLEAGMAGLKPRAKTLVELADAALIYVRARPLPIEAKAAQLLDAAPDGLLQGAAAAFASLEPWSEVELEACCRRLAEEAGLGLGKLAQPLRAAVTGRSASPGLFEVMRVLGREEVAGRIDDALRGLGRNAAVQ